MSSTNITSANGGVRMQRKDVPPYAVLSYIVDGNVSDKKYIALGNVGSKSIGLSVATGSMSSSSKNNRQCKLRGNGVFEVKLRPSSGYRTCKRNDVRAGEVFIIPRGASGKSGKPIPYAHVGTLKNGTNVSVNLESRDIASRRNASNGNVQVVGDWGLQALEAQ